MQGTGKLSLLISRAMRVFVLIITLFAFLLSAIPAQAGSATPPGHKPGKYSRWSYPSQIAYGPIEDGNGNIGSGPAPGAFMTLPFMGPHYVTSVFDHCGPNYSSHGKVCRYDGKVASAGRQNGYGNAVVLQHGAAFSTLYAHLSRFAGGVKPGARVAQGDVIGYVGQTGWATGPHLHYEFRVNSEQRDPMTIALPAAQPLPAAALAGYLGRVSVLSAQLALGHGVTLAGAE